jgi:ribonuclease III family protein
MSTTDLAYIGDVVYELFIRSHMIWPPQRTSVLQDKVVALVRAEYQAQILHCILVQDNDSNSNNNNNNTETDSSNIHGSTFVLTAEERRVVSRGRNAVSGGSKRRSRNSDKTSAKAYQDATALEALIGHAYISNPGRCAQLLTYIQQEFLSSSLPSSAAAVVE